MINPRAVVDAQIGVRLLSSFDRIAGVCKGCFPPIADMVTSKVTLAATLLAADVMHTGRESAVQTGAP